MVLILASVVSRCCRGGELGKFVFEVSRKRTNIVFITQYAFSIGSVPSLPSVSRSFSSLVSVFSVTSFFTCISNFASISPSLTFSFNLPRELRT